MATECFDSSTYYANRHRRTYTHTSPPLKVMVPPLISVFRSNMLSPPKDAYPLVFAISYRVCLRWLLHIELCHDFTHNSDKKISIIDKLLQISMATKYELVNDCVKVARCKRYLFFSCVCLMASMARSVNCHGQKNAVQVHLIGAEPIVQVKR